MCKGSALVSSLVTLLAGVVAGPLASGCSKGKVSAERAAEADNGTVTTVASAKDDSGIERFKIPVTAAQPVKGPEDAPVTIVVVSDYQCPFCSRVEPTLAQLAHDYQGRLRFAWRDNPLPFHENALPAAEAAREALVQGGSDKFWQMHDKLFANQPALARENLDGYARELGLDLDKFKHALDAHTHKPRIDSDRLAAAALGASGTPAFFINGRFLSGAQPIERFKEVIDDELKRADKLVAGGVAKKAVYATLTANGLTAKSPTPAAQPQTPRTQPDPTAVYKVPIGTSPAKGPADALVTIVEFSDFQCPFCTRVEPTLKKVVETYGKDVRIVFKQNPLPFHNNAPLAAQAALAAHEQGKFWPMHDLLFANQGALERDNLEGYAHGLGLNMSKFKRALDTNQYKAVVDADRQLARSLGAPGTPAFFVNGRYLRGAKPYEAFKPLIDEELAKARQLVAAGTPKARLYAKLIEHGATTPQTIQVQGAPVPAAVPAAAEPDANKIYALASAARAPSKGATTAKVVIEQFSDFQCPFCSRVEPTVQQILDSYAKDVKVVWHNFPLPFHENAVPAAEAALDVFEQAGSAKFWQYHALLFANQQALGRADLERYAQQIGGIDLAQFKAALDSHKHKASIETDSAAIDKAGVHIGTPAFFINGKLMQGAQPFEAFKTAIDKALAEAK